MKDSNKENKDKKQSENTAYYLPLFMSIGVSIGVAIGAATRNIPLCMSIGLSIGVGLGAVLDANARKEKKNDSPKETDKTE